MIGAISGAIYHAGQSKNPTHDYKWANNREIDCNSIVSIQRACDKYIGYKVAIPLGFITRLEELSGESMMTKDLIDMYKRYNASIQS